MNILQQRIAALRQGDQATVVGFGLTAVWLLLIALFWLFGSEGQGGTSGLARLAAFAAVILPIVLIWLAVGLARSIASLRAEAEELRHRLQLMRDASGPPPRAGRTATYEGFSPAETAPTPAPAQSPARASAPVRTAPTPPPPAAAKPRPTDGRQAAMRFDGPESVAVDPGEMILALNFPDGPDDHRAIDALRAALRDHENARVIRAAQDVVTLFATNDLYMDNLPPEPVQPAVWRRFAEGVRGEAVDALGGIHDPTALELAEAMLKSDEIFRDAAHHFLRHFDLTVSRLVPMLDDDQIARLGNTRSARAFMLLGRAAGVFG